MKQINPDVVAAYPITPQTSLMQKFADFVADGDVDTEMVLVESEHSAMSACVGSAAAGARTMTATSANGLALMWEILYIASGNRLPIVMPVVNRALSAPINIHGDHSDTMGARDSSWIQLFSENAQEAYENTIQAVRIAEHKDVLLPIMVTLDGFIISHGMETVDIYDDKRVKDFVGEFKPDHTLLNFKKPLTFGPLDLFDYYFEHKRQQAEGMKNALRVIEEVGMDFRKTFGKAYRHTEGYKLDDADVAIVLLGSTAGTAKEVIDQLRQEGKKVGQLKIRTFRPFPEEEIANILSRFKAIAVLDRSDGFNAIGGPLYNDIKAALYGKTSVPIVNYIYGLGGRDIPVGDIRKVFEDLLETARTKEIKEPLTYLGVR
ncbi:MAG: pyruvate ferredoxin oxidoreductase [Candidatus Omnitrophica bacterium]|nr:pyruvate ferredoxin oxidoreductase [Candidatus Omnitrophota bacterium]